VLDDFDPKIGTYDWIPGIKTAVSRDGKMYAMRVNSGVQARLYNKDLYKRAGLDPEKPPETFDELLTVVGKISALGDEIWGHYIPTAPVLQTGATTSIRCFGPWAEIASPRMARRSPSIRPRR